MESEKVISADKAYQCRNGHTIRIGGPLTVDYNDDVTDVHITSGPLCPRCFINLYRDRCSAVEVPILDLDESTKGGSK